jgi:hypothetical protein
MGKGLAPSSDTGQSFDFNEKPPTGRLFSSFNSDLDESLPKGNMLLFAINRLLIAHISHTPTLAYEAYNLRLNDSKKRKIIS